jgi:ABC-2 type transport system permease protein
MTKIAQRSRHFLLTMLTIWQREVIRTLRDKTRIIAAAQQPVAFLFIFGSGLRESLATGNLGVDYVEFMYPGIIAMTVMGVAFFSTISTVWDREFGFLKEILVAPVSRTAIALGKTMGAATTASVQGLILLALAPIIDVRLPPESIPLLVACMLLLSFAVSATGLFLASLMRTTESFGLLVQIMVFPMFFLSGAFFPLTEVPTWMVVLSNINPLTYGVDAFRQVILGDALAPQVARRIFLYPLPVDAAFLLVFTTVMILAAVVAFNRKS